jgi:hypothetical protein
MFKLYRLVVDSRFFLFNNPAIPNSVLKVSIFKDLLLSLKLLIKQIFFFKRQKLHKLVFFIKDDFLYNFVTLFFKKYFIKTFPVQILQRVPRSFKNTYFASCKKAVFFFNLSNKQVDLVKKFYYKNSLLLNYLSLNFFVQKHGIYMLLNDFNDLKKILFLLLLVHKIYRKRKIRIKRYAKTKV